MGPALGPVLGPAGPCNGMLACVSGAPSPPSPAAGLTGLGQQRPPEGSAYLPCLCTSPWASRLCRCGRLHGNNGERESSDRRTWQAGEDVRRDRIPAALPSVRNGAYLFFFTLSPKAGVRLGMAEGGESRRCSGSQWGQGKRRGAMIFVRWDPSVFHCLAKYPGMQLRSHLSSLGWQHQGHGDRSCHGASAMVAARSCCIYRPESARYVHEKKIFSNYFRWGGEKEKNL